MLSLCKTKKISGALRAQNHISSRTLYDSKQDQIRLKDLGTKSQWILKTSREGKSCCHASPRGKIGILLWKPEPSQATTTKPGTNERWTKRRSGDNYSMRRFGPKPRGGWKYFSSSDFWKPIRIRNGLWESKTRFVFTGVAISERWVEWIIIPWCKNNRQIDREPSRAPPPPPLPRYRSSRKYRSSGD